MAETRRIKVFLCHAHSDAAAVRDLFRYLRNEGVDAWLDKESLLPGADWEFEIRKAVRASDVVIVCLSKQFNQAGFRQKEVRIAIDTAMEKPEGEIFIIPARLEECDAPPSLHKWHWVDLFEDGGRQKLIRALKARASQVGAGLRRWTDEAEEFPSEEPQPLATLEKPGRNEQKEDLSWLNYLGVKEEPGKNAQEEDLSWLSYLSDGSKEQETRSGIWVDNEWNVWRDSTRLGTLHDEVEHKLLTFLIERKGRVCFIPLIATHVFGSPFTLRAFEFPRVNRSELLNSAARNIQALIEEDVENPKFLTISEMAYKLDW